MRVGQLVGPHGRKVVIRDVIRLVETVLIHHLPIRIADQSKQRDFEFVKLASRIGAEAPNFALGNSKASVALNWRRLSFWK